jgi:hypothetical protein
MCARIRHRNNPVDVIGVPWSGSGTYQLYAQSVNKRDSRLSTSPATAKNIQEDARWQNATDDTIKIVLGWHVAIASFAYIIMQIGDHSSSEPGRFYLLQSAAVSAMQSG